VPGMGGVAGRAVVRHTGVDKISFTGSTATGQEIIRESAGNLKRLSLELGGKSPNIVFGDAELDIAVPGVARAIFGNSGQVCTAGARVLVQDEIYDDFMAGMVAFAEKLRIGPGLTPGSQVGPLISAAQLSRV